MKTAVDAVIIASLSFVVAAVSCVIAVKNYRKSKRLEFFQRRDQLFTKISDLNNTNTESHLISARYEIVRQAKAYLVLEGKRAEQNQELIDSIQQLRDQMAVAAANWDNFIDRLHTLSFNLTNKEIAKVEYLIATVQIATDDLRKVNDISLASLQILEGVGPLDKAALDKLRENETQLAQLQTVMKQLNERASG